MDHIELARVKFRELLANRQGNHRGADGADGALNAKDLGEIAALYILHGDKEVSIDIAEIVNLDDSRIECLQVAQNGCAAPLRFENLLGGMVGIALDQFQGGLAVIDGVDGKVHVGHAFAKLPYNFI